MKKKLISDARRSLRRLWRHNLSKMTARLRSSNLNRSSRLSLKKFRKPKLSPNRRKS